MSLPTRWIICTKWAVVDVEASNLAAKNFPPPSADSKEPQAQPDTVLKYFWTPVGSPHIYTKKSKISGTPVSYSTEQEAIDGLKKIVNDDPKLSRQDLKFSVVEVRYVPNKIKVYKQDWYNKYGVKETELVLKDHKFVDTIK